MKIVEFKFDIDDKVYTPFGDDGIISMCAIDDGGNIYFVKTSKNEGWFKESQLTKK